LLDVIAVVDAVMPQGVTESPEFGNYIRHASIMNILTGLTGSSGFPCLSPSPASGPEGWKGKTQSACGGKRRKMLYPVHPVNPV